MTPAFPISTRGRAALVELVDRGVWSQHSLARDVEAAQPTVRAWLLGTSRPGPHMRVAVELVTGIPSHDWNTDDENAHVERVRAKVAAARKRRPPRRLTTGAQPVARVEPGECPSHTGTE